VPVVPTEKIKELEDMCALNLLNYEKQRDQNAQLMRENKNLEIHLLNLG
jgi:hypothetical protein